MGWFTSDNASNNDTAMKYLENPSMLSQDDPDGRKYDLIPDGEYQGTQHRIRLVSYMYFPEEYLFDFSSDVDVVHTSFTLRLNIS